MAPLAGGGFAGWPAFWRTYFYRVPICAAEPWRRVPLRGDERSRNDFRRGISYGPTHATQAAGHRHSHSRLAHVDGSLLAIEVWVQGVLAGAGTIYTYARTVQYLGAARAAIFPALVPGFATLMGWPVLGHIPTLTEAIGLTLAIAGLLVTVTQRTGKS